MLLPRARFLLPAITIGLLLVVMSVVLPSVTVAFAAPTSPASASKSQIKDVDRDRIPDDVEVTVCGTATCATGLEDRDKDGIPDWIEVMSCGERTCADPKADQDGDGIPDYAERLVCDSDTCSNSREDADGDGIGDWSEFVICGDRTCATGDEDYDGDGVSDAVQLAACVKQVDNLAITGQPWFWGVVVAGILAMGAGAWLFVRARRNQSRTSEVTAGEVSDGVE